MNDTIQRPKALWTHKNAPNSVQSYFDAHQGEFELRRMKSSYPYEGSPWKKFRELKEINHYEGFKRFEGRGEGCWEPFPDKIRSGCTADLLAAAELMRGDLVPSGTYGTPGGFGIDERDVWVGFLDGGIGVEVQVGQDEDTNRPFGWQRTTIRGALAFRCLLEVLGFTWVGQRLTGEDKLSPSHEEVIKIVRERLAAALNSPDERGG